MASILEFRQPAFGSRQTGVRTETAASADIVLFPGVRYERWTEDEATAAEPAKSRRRARRRDHLELED